MNRTILALAALALAAPCYGQETRSILKGSTDQSVYIRIVDAADGTPETGVTSATAGLDLEYVRNRAAAADLTESDLAAVDSAHSDGGIKHVGNGVYRVDLPDAACATGVDGVLVTGTATDMVVIPARIQLTGFDLQTATQAVNVTTWNGTAVATPDTAGYPKVTIKDGTGTGEIDTTSGGVALATGQEIEVADADLRSALGMAAADLDTQLDAIVADTNELQTDWVNGGRLDLILDDILLDTGTTLQAEVDGIQADTEDIQARLPAALVSGRMDASVGAMASGVVTASAVATNAIDADALATDAQGEFAAGVWNALTASYVAADSFGEAFSTNSSLIGDINAATGNTDSVVANMWAVVGNLDTMIQLDGADYEFKASALEEAPSGGLNATQVADAVWDATMTDHLDAGSTGAALNAAGSAGDPWTTTLPGSYTGSQAGKILSDILADTNELQTDWANGGRLDLLVDAIKAITDQLGAAQAEPTGVPAANETPLDKLAYVFMMLRNKITVTADTKTYFDDGGAAEFKKGLTDDGTTYTEAEAEAP